MLTAARTSLHRSMCRTHTAAQHTPVTHCPGISVAPSGTYTGVTLYEGSRQQVANHTDRSYRRAETCSWLPAKAHTQCVKCIVHRCSAYYDKQEFSTQVFIQRQRYEQCSSCPNFTELLGVRFSDFTMYTVSATLC
jgi:hypothetical protein